MNTAHARMARILGVVALVSALSLLVGTQRGRGAPLSPSAPIPNPCAPFAPADLNEQSRDVELAFSRVQGIDVDYHATHMGGVEGMDIRIGGDFSMRIGAHVIRSGCPGVLFINLEARDNPSKVGVLQSCATLVATSGSNPVSFRFLYAKLSDLKSTRSGDFTFVYVMSGAVAPDLRCSR